LDDLDWQLCQQCQAGDADACASLLKRHEAAIARQMWRFARDRAIQAELVQEVLVEAFLSLGNYRRQSVPFVHWLHRIATRVGYRYWKQLARKRRHQPIEDIDVAAPLVAPVSAAAEAAGAAKILHDLLAELPAADRLVLTFMYFDQLSLKQIADQTGWLVTVVKMRAHRARAKLRKLIESRNLTARLMEFSNGPA
jgi:RNA polymerase sigma-70 factor, ECF subfamily